MKFPIFVKYSVSRTSAALSGSAMGRQQRSSREYAGELYSEEHKRKFKTEKVRASAESPDGRD